MRITYQKALCIISVVASQEMKPKILQKILGHSNISMTLDLYVHATQDEMQKEMQLLEKLA